MRFSVRLFQSSAVSCLAVLHLASLEACSIDRGKRHLYWSGRPQTIGIDLSHNAAVAVYANGTSNFTILATAIPNGNNEYQKHMYASFLRWSHGKVIHRIVVSEPWLDQSFLSISSWISKKSEGWYLQACEKAHPDLLPARRRRRICESQIAPQRPKSRYRRLLSQAQRTAKLRSIMPKWFRTSPPKGLTKSGFILSVAELLLELKRTALADHGVVITSATVSRPSWISHNENAIIDEACLLAGIELWEPPQKRSEMATTGINPDKSVIVIDSGPWNRDIVRLQWYGVRKGYVERQRLVTAYYRPDRLAVPWANYFSSQLNISAVSSGDNRISNRWIEGIARMRRAIKYGRWPPDMDFVDRTGVLNFGSVKNLTITGQDVLDLEDVYVDDLSTMLKKFVYNDEAIASYAYQTAGIKDPWVRSGDETESYDDTITSMGDTITPPPELGLEPFIWPIDHVVILDTGHEVSFLAQVAQRAFNLSIESASNDSETCIPSYGLAARGAALHAVEGTRQYDAEHGGEWKWDFDIGDWAKQDKGRPSGEGESQIQNLDTIQEEL